MNQFFLEIFYLRLTKYYFEKWTQDKGNSSKLAIYHTFKSELKPERYLLMSNWNCISSLARFRCSNHKLSIGEGRNTAINLEKRLCKFCDSIQVCVIEDEFHFLPICSLFKELRDIYFRNVITDCTFNNFLELTCSNDIWALLNISLFVKNGMKKRLEWRNMYYMF